MAAKSSYKPEYIEQARKLCLLGATDVEVADFFGVSPSTLYLWKNAHPEFSNALKSGKDEADERVERSLYHKAIGYSFDSEKVFQFQGQIVRAPFREHVPPSDTACIFWLKNRRANEWRDVHRHEVGKPGEFESMNANQLREYIARETAKLGIGATKVEAPRSSSKLN